MKMELIKAESDHLGTTMRQQVQDTAHQIQTMLNAALALEGDQLAEFRYCQIEMAHLLAKELNHAMDSSHQRQTN